MTKKRALGRGLGALIEEPEASQAGRPLEVSIDQIEPNPYQPRARIDPESLKSLAESIKIKGVLEPLLVRPKDPSGYELIAGERRLRAAKAAGFDMVPVILKNVTQTEMLELALIENLHREDLNPMEEAESYQRLSDEFGRTQEEIAQIAGKERSTVANLMRLLALPDPVQEDVRQGRLSAGHARALLGLPGMDQILLYRNEVLMRGLSVRETEALVKRALKSKTKKPETTSDKAYFDSLGEAMSRRLGARVRLLHKGRKGGRIEISYSSNDELERIMKILGPGSV